MWIVWTAGWVVGMETLKLSIRVLAGRAVKLSNFERFRTLKISIRVLRF